MFDYDSAGTLKIGDTIIEGTDGAPREINVRRLSPCTLSKRGVPKVHVNDDACYDTIGILKIRRQGEAAEGSQKARETSKGIRRTRGTSSRLESRKNGR
jgi:hypothetical protein